MSIHIRDPDLTTYGRAAAAAYGAILRPLLGDPIVCASALRRAQETAQLVFGKEPRILTGISENGEIAENIPMGGAFHPPNWEEFLDQLAGFVSDGDSVAVVSHGAFLQSLWPILTGAERPNRLNNLDGILCEVELGPEFKVLSHKEFLHTANAKAEGDTCSVRDAEKIAELDRSMNKFNKSNKSNKSHKSQRGGTNTPLAMFKDGAQMQGTYAEATGAQPSAWFRPALTQSGGRMTRKRKQKGGFTPSVMGSFATNGLRLMPVAAYMGYKMYSGKTRKTKRVKKAKRVRRQRR